MKKILYYSCLLFLLIHQAGRAQNRISATQRTRILFILDASGSMKDKWNNVPKFNTAKQVIRQMMDSVKNDKNIEVALRVFGHQSPREEQNCNDTKLEVPFSSKSLNLIDIRLDSLNPQGYTPIALSLKESVNDFQKNANIKNIIILLTDGVENCAGNICDAAAELIGKGIAFKPYIVGLGLSEEQTKLFECAGKIFNIAEEKQARVITSVVISTALNPTSLQINLLNAYGRATESNLNMSFYDLLNKDLKYNIYHTLSAAGTADTLFIAPDNGYKVVIHSLPATVKDTVKLVPGKNTLSAVDVAQGTLSLKIDGIPRYKNLKGVVRKSGGTSIINAQDINTSKNYLLGTYDIEILTLPRMSYKNIEIKQSEENLIRLPAPGTVNVSFAKPGYANLFLMDNGTIRKIYSFNPALLSQSLFLQPGEYQVQYRDKAADKSSSTTDRSFKIIPGAAVNLKF